MKKLTCTYLFADGHAVQVFEKNDRDAGTVRFCEIHERFTEAALRFTGRLIFGRYEDGMPSLVKQALRIEAQEASANSGSDKTRAMGIAVGWLALDLKGGRVQFDSMPSILSSSYTYQPGSDYAETFDPNALTWGDCRVAKIHRAKEVPAA